MNSIVFSTEITLYWDKQRGLNEAPCYQILLDDKLVATTEKTHFSILDLTADTSYKVTVNRLEKGEVRETLFCEIITTKKLKNRIDVTKEPYLAVGDGKTLNTSSIQKALDDCDENSYVYIPVGNFLTGALNVHSNTEIYIEKGAVLQGSSQLSDYTPKIKSRFEGTEMMCYRSLLNMGELDRNAAYNCENVVIRGGGTIYGGGKALADNIIEFETERLKDYLEQNPEYVASCENNKTIPGRARGRLVNMSNCRNVILSNLTLGFGPAWNIHMIYSKDIVTYSCKIESSGVWNGDGWDPDSSENCTVFGTEFRTHDDGIAIKSGKNPEGNIVNRPTKNVKIFDCHGRRGIAIGSEVSGGIDGVFVWDCEYLDSLGITVKTTNKRGGYIKNINVSDSVMAGICIRTNVNYNNDGEAAETLTELENYTFENLTLLAEVIGWKGERCRQTPISIEGFESEESFIKNVTLKGIKIIKAEDNPVENLRISGVNNLIIEDLK